MKKHLFGKVVFVLIITFGIALSFLVQGCREKEARHEKTGITGITKGSVDIAIPPSTPSDKIWCYGLGFPFQVAPRKAGIFCNIRLDGIKSIDLEVGSDVILFDDLADIRSDGAISLSRYETGKSFLIRKGPVTGGFVPIGAKLADGSSHPHAGTGFGMCWAIRQTLDETGNYDYRESSDNFFEFFQFAYDGKVFKVLEKERVESENILPKWELAGLGISNAIPDGNDFLFCMTAKKDTILVEGIARWQYGVHGWLPISFIPVTGSRENDKGKWRSGGEASLIRDVDGSLLFSARSGYGSDSTAAFDVAVWRSPDNGETWKQIIYRKNYRSRSPVSINQAADGTPFIAANLPPRDRTREVLCYWPLNATRTDLEDIVIARDLPAEFGPAPSGSWWRIDHPTSAIIQLKDGEWHSLLVYRIADNGELESDAPPTPQTGCYVEEILSKGKAIPAWQF